MIGRSVDVLRPSVEHVDGDPTTTWRRERVRDVLVMPAETGDNGADDRPDGTRVAVSCAFPKAFGRPLRGCVLEIDGERFAVEGDPRPVAENCPTRWNRTVKAPRCDG